MTNIIDRFVQVTAELQNEINQYTTKNLHWEQASTLQVQTITSLLWLMPAGRSFLVGTYGCVYICIYLLHQHPPPQTPAPGNLGPPKAWELDSSTIASPTGGDII